MSRLRLLAAAASILTASILTASILTVAIVASSLLSRPHVVAAAAPTDHASATPVLVELFTSEGCSDCPPADALLAKLQQQQPVAGANIIALEEHVDYWDHLGWRDRFSSHDLTARQNQYTLRLHLDDNYTPQMVVNGTDQFVGSDSARALRSIASAARTPALALALSSIGLSASSITGIASAQPAKGQPVRADLYAALLQRSASTTVLRGENGGHTLHHVSIVLGLQKIGDTLAPRSFSLALPQGVDPAGLGIVIFAQQPGQGAVLGALTAAAPLASSNPRISAAFPPSKISTAPHGGIQRKAD